MMVLSPLENIPESHKKLLGPMSFDGKIMGGNKIKNFPIILKAKLRLYVTI
jgi:hypothetical protein